MTLAMVFAFAMLASLTAAVPLSGIPSSSWNSPPAPSSNGNGGSPSSWVPAPSSPPDPSSNGNGGAQSSWVPAPSSIPWTPSPSSWAPQSTSGAASIPPSWTPSALPSSTPSGAPEPSGSPSGGLGDSYTFYSGDGSTGAGWPDQTSWVDFESMWQANSPAIAESCDQFGQANPSSDEMSDMYNAIQSVSGESGVDPRFILAIIMQESKGCVRVWTTNYGVNNPGLMQDHDGSGTCNTGTSTSPGEVQNPCPSSEITQMITDGTEGTSAGDGLVQCLSEAGASDVSEYYKAARIYNSGQVDPSGDLGAGIATHCYSSDVANRLTGWVFAASTCTLDG